MPSKTFGQLMRHWREEKEVTLRVVAEHLGYKIPHVSDIERGNRNPPPDDKIRLLADLLGKADQVEDLLVAAMRTRDNSITFQTSDARGQKALVRLQRRLTDRDVFDRLLAILNEKEGTEDGE